MADGYDPAVDTDTALRPERIAAFRLFLWTELFIPPTVLQQLSATRSPERRQVLLDTVKWNPAKPPIKAEALPAISARAEALLAFHRDPADCSIVTEAEYFGASALLSFDQQLRRRLQFHTDLALHSPSEHWQCLAIPRETPPRWTPDPSNPMSRQTWWHW